MKMVSAIAALAEGRIKMKIERIVKFTFSEADLETFQKAKRFFDDMSDDDYEALTDELTTVRELYDSLDDFINMIIDNME